MGTFLAEGAKTGTWNRNARNGMYVLKNGMVLLPGSKI
jgi:hypothetical protein